MLSFDLFIKLLILVINISAPTLHSNFRLVTIVYYMDIIIELHYITEFYSLITLGTHN